MVKQPLFILAAPRSFTSLLCSMIGQHPQAYGVPELNLFLADTIEELLATRTGLTSFQLHGILRTIAELYTGEQTLLSIETAQRHLINNATANTGKFYMKLCQKVSPLQIVDKSPAYSIIPNALGRINQIFPEAFYLHITRHPRTQGNSMMKIGEGKMAILSNSIDYSTDPPTIDPQYIWAHIQRTILNFLELVPPERKMRLRGEGVIAEPKVYFEKIANWLGWNWNETAAEAMLNPQNSPYSCIGPYGAPLGNDPNFLHSPIFKPRPKAAEANLEDPLPWRYDGKGFIPDVIDLARELNYA